jgi:hypothetical protein
MMDTFDAGTRASREPEASRRISQLLRCRHCGEVIGVYEPLVRVSGGHVSESSRALEPGASAREGERYHSACYERLGGGQPLAD